MVDISNVKFVLESNQHLTCVHTSFKCLTVREMALIYTEIYKVEVALTKKKDIGQFQSWWCGKVRRLKVLTVAGQCEWDILLEYIWDRNEFSRNFGSPDENDVAGGFVFLQIKWRGEAIYVLNWILGSRGLGLSEVCIFVCVLIIYDSWKLCFFITRLNAKQKRSLRFTRLFKPFILDQ